MWDSPHISTNTEGDFERDDTEESDFQDDGDYVLLRYDIKIEQDLEVQDAIKQVQSVIAVIEERTDQNLVVIERHKTSLWSDLRPKSGRKDIWFL